MGIATTRSDRLERGEPSLRVTPDGARQLGAPVPAARGNGAGKSSQVTSAEDGRLVDVCKVLPRVFGSASDAVLVLPVYGVALGVAR